MKKYKIAVINPNSYKMNYGDSEEKICHDIKKDIKIIEIEHENLVENIVKELNLTTNQIGDSSICYENDEVVYQLFYLDNKKRDKDEKINGICSILSLDHVEIYGKCILMVTKIVEDYTCRPSSLTENDIVKLLYKKANHKCLIVKPGEIETSIFTHDPLEKIDKDEIKNYKYIEFNILKFNLIIFIQIKAKPDKINKKMTCLIGDKKIYGTCIIASKSTENEYLDIDNKLFKKLYLLSQSKLSYRDLSEDEKNDKKIKGLPVVQNRYCILKQRLKNHIEKCTGCGKELENKYICAGCYRAIYHDPKCQKWDWQYHKDDCLYESGRFNKILEHKK